ncbi:unnamed protein product [Rangifer tarandus platyrhynchus]|uniref:Uncharacterized protein n=1 Tax=Rangifer tarandus platyrhynchus TaxID=3082113 RepID=A0AC59Y1H5_RANTA
MPLLGPCCPLLGEQELTSTLLQRGATWWFTLPALPLEDPTYRLYGASHATIQPRMAASGVQDNIMEACRPAEIKPAGHLPVLLTSCHWAAPPDWASSSDVDNSSVKGILRGWNNRVRRVCLSGVHCEFQTEIDRGQAVFIFVT